MCFEKGKTEKVLDLSLDPKKVYMDLIWGLCFSLDLEESLILKHSENYISRDREKHWCGLTLISFRYEGIIDSGKL